SARGPEPRLRTRRYPPIFSMRPSCTGRPAGRLPDAPNCGEAIRDGSWGGAEPSILVVMARKSSSESTKEPGRLKQMYQVFQMTRRYDPTSVWWMALGFAGPLLLGLLLALLLARDSVFGLVLWI